MANLVQKIVSIDIGIRNLGMSLLEYDFNTLQQSTLQQNKPLNNSNEELKEIKEDTETNKTILNPWSWKKLKILQLELVDIVKEVTKDKKQRAGAKEKNSKNININIICQGVVSILMQRVHWLDGVTKICIEQQPIMRSRFRQGGCKGGSVGSVRMKIIQHCILTFYETYYTLHPHLIKPSILPASPGNKLKCIINPDNFCMEPKSSTDKNTIYTQRKDKTEEDFTKFIEWCDIKPELKTLFHDTNKKNDMSDCILQAVFELQNFGTELIQKQSKQLLKEQKKKEKGKNEPKEKTKRGTKRKKQESCIDVDILDDF